MCFGKIWRGLFNKTDIQEMHLFINIASQICTPNHLPYNHAGPGFGLLSLTVTKILTSSPLRWLSVNDHNMCNVSF